MKRVLLVLLLFASSAWGQNLKVRNPAIRLYLGDLVDDFEGYSNNPAAVPRITKAEADFEKRFSPARNPEAFAIYILSTPWASSRFSELFAQQAKQAAAHGQTNKMLGSTSGNSGTTSLLSSSVASDIFSMAMEYGAIRQTTSGNVTTFRANLLGTAGLFVNNPYLGCKPVEWPIKTQTRTVPSDTIKEEPGGCNTVSDWLRGFSSSISVETASNADSSKITGTNSNTNLTETALFPEGDSRMNSWGIRFDWFRRTVYDSQQVTGFGLKLGERLRAISKSKTQQGDITEAIKRTIANQPDWEGNFAAALRNAESKELELEAQLNSLGQSVLADAQTLALVNFLQDGIVRSLLDPEEIVRELQNLRFSTEFNSLHPLGQPNYSNVRMVLSYQPGKMPLLLTFNFATEWYNEVPASMKKWRDVQTAAQVERSLGEIPNLGPSRLTLAYYHQWMLEDALMTIPSGNTVSGTGIVLPGPANLLLAPKGNIHILQARLSFQVKDVVKVPVSFTWSNRSELVNESEKRGQIGFTLDLDSLFKKKPASR
jgi:hypothetical protein